MDLATVAARWAALSARIRWLITAAGVTVLAVVLLFGAVSHGQRTALFAAPLHSEQLTEVQERLAAWNVAFVPLADNVLVDASRRNDLLLKLSMAGVPHAHLDGSADVLAKLGALTPQSVIDAQARDGLAADIALALRGIEGVQDARVIVAPAKAGYFADEQNREATASVRLRLAGGSALSPQAVAGIRGFVAAAVPGLTARSVTIVDDSGAALDDAAGSGNDQQTDMQRSLQSALDSALGAGVAVVRVRVEYDRRTLTSKDVRRAPLASLPISANSQDERYSGEGKRYDRSAQQLDRGSDTRESEISFEGARLARISAAVMVDAARGADLAQVRALAAATLGINRTRGDELDVEAVSFSHAPAAKKDAWWLAYGALTALLPSLIPAGALLLLLRWFRAPVRAWLRSAGEQRKIAHASNAVQGAEPAVVRGALRDEPPHTAAAIISALPAATAAAVLDMYPEAERSAIIRRMQRPCSPLTASANRFTAGV